MTVKYIGEDVKYSGLKKLDVYTVISIDFILNQNPLFYSARFRILNTNGIAGLYDQSLFEVLDNSYASDFIFKPYSEGSFELVPELMSYSGYWEDFFDGESNAVSIFKERFPEYRDKVF